MKSFAFETWDGGRLRVNLDYADLLCRHKLTTFSSLYHYAGGQVAKELVRERRTTRIELGDSGQSQAFYLKRHAPPPWREYWKPLLRLRWPILGARHEWEAILRFHAAGVSTMIPVALGEQGGNSFLLTAAIDGCTKLSKWLSDQADEVKHGAPRELVARIAALARAMHGAGLHHQDFYAGHLLITPDEQDVHVIDLGRACQRRPLAPRWKIKDLAQLQYSASMLPPRDRLRFLRAYLGRPLSAEDKGLIRQISEKSAAIAQHSAKHGL